MIAIIGAGIVGVSAAIWLQRQGQDVVLIDREGPAAGTSYGNAGVLARGSVVPVNSPGLLSGAPRMLCDPASPLFLCWGHVPRMLPWLFGYARRANAIDARRASRALNLLLSDCVQQHEDLCSGTSAAEYLRSGDYVIVYRDREDFVKDAFAWRLRDEAGVEYHELDATALQAYDPRFCHLGEFAIAMTGHGQLTDPGAYVKALAAHFVAAGGRLLVGEVENFLIEKKRLVGLGTSQGPIDCDHAVISCGAWSAGLTRSLGLKTPLETERGYHLELCNPSCYPRSPMLYNAAKVAVAPMKGRIRCAGILEFGGLHRQPGQAPQRLLKKILNDIFPDLEYDGIRQWMGHRPAPVDSIPYIGPVETVAGVYTAFGHHHVGMSAGPVTGRLIANLIGGDAPDRDLAAFRPARFTHRGNHVFNGRPARPDPAR